MKKINSTILTVGKDFYLENQIAVELRHCECLDGQGLLA